MSTNKYNDECLMHNPVQFDSYSDHNLFQVCPVNCLSSHSIRLYQQYCSNQGTVMITSTMINCSFLTLVTNCFQILGVLY
jgi:ferredoxin-like protein FixX